MTKKSRLGGQPNPAIRLSNLSPRATKLFAEAANIPAVPSELDGLTNGLKPASFLPLLISALTAIPETQREAVEASVGAWLRERGHMERLHSLEARHTFRGPARSVARSLLVASGFSLVPEAAVEPADLFLAAFELGETSQDSPTLFWYEDERRRRVCSAAFLVDFEPPWEGALKDIAFARHRTLDEAVGEFRIHWRLSGLEPQPLDAATAAQRVWAALRQNQEQSIRLPTDFIAVLPQILPFLMTLPLSAGAEPLSQAELEALVTVGRNPESIKREERLLGYQTRMPDGSVIRVMRPQEDEMFE